MLDQNSTIIIPMFRQPHLLLQVVRGLSRYSSARHKIVVVYSNPGEGMRELTDWAVDSNGRAVRYAESVKSIAKQVEDWGNGNIKVVDCTEERGRADIGDWPAADCAWKINFGLKFVHTEWVAPGWDADYYPLPRWDHFMMEAISFTGQRGVYVPQFSPVTGRQVETGNLPQFPATFQHGWSGYLTHDDISNLPDGSVDALISTTDWANTAVAINPQFWRSSDLLMDGEEFPVPIPPLGETHEWLLAKKAQKKGLTRYAHCRSWIFHKMSIADEGMDILG